MFGSASVLRTIISVSALPLPIFKVRCVYYLTDPSRPQLKSGLIAKETFDRDILVGEIGDVIGGKIDPADPKNRSPDDITVFESLGIALQDLTAARAILENAAGK